MDVASDAAVARAVALTGAEVLMQIRQRASDDPGLDASALARAADAAAQDRMASELARLRPNDAILSEEAEDSPLRLQADRVWIIDPLDGTREFAERASDRTWRVDFAVHVALWQRDAGLTAGAVALPGIEAVHGTDTTVSFQEPTARSSHHRRRGRLRIAVSRSRPPGWAARLASGGDAELVPMGSLGFKAMAVLRGEVDAYVHAGGLHEWDAAAPAAVARSAGLIVSRLDGSELQYNQPIPWIPDLLVCRPTLIDRMQSLLGPLTMS